MHAPLSDSHRSWPALYKYISPEGERGPVALSASVCVCYFLGLLGVFLVLFGRKVLLVCAKLSLLCSILGFRILNPCRSLKRIVGLLGLLVINLLHASVKIVFELSVTMYRIGWDLICAELFYSLFNSWLQNIEFVPIFAEVRSWYYLVLIGDFSDFLIVDFWGALIEIMAKGYSPIIW